MPSLAPKKSKKEEALLQRVSASLDEGRRHAVPPLAAAAASSKTDDEEQTSGRSRRDGDLPPLLLPAFAKTNDEIVAVNASDAAAAKDFLAVRALIKSISKACVSEGVVVGDNKIGEEVDTLIDALVNEYRGRYVSLTKAMLLDGIAKYPTLAAMEAAGVKADGDDDDDPDDDNMAFLLDNAMKTDELPDLSGDTKAEDGGIGAPSKFDRIVSAVERDMAEYDKKINEIKVRRSLCGEEFSPAVGKNSKQAVKKVTTTNDEQGTGEGKKRGRYNTKNTKKNAEEELLINEIYKKYAAEGEGLNTLTEDRLMTIISETKQELNLEYTENININWKMLDRRVKYLHFGGKRPGGRKPSAEPKAKRIKTKPTGGYRGKDTDEGRLVAEIARKYTEERKQFPRLEKGRFEAIVTETVREMGLEGVDLGTMQQLDHRVRFIYQRHKNPESEEGAALDKKLVDEIYIRYRDAKLTNGVDGRGLAKGTFEKIIAAVRDEQGLEPDPGRMRAIRQKVQGRFTRENPQFEIENPKTRLKVSELSEVDKRRRETLINEVTARYLRERDDANKGTTMTKQGPRSLKMADGSIPKIIEEVKNELGIHDFEVNMSSIRGRIHRQSLFVSKVRKGTKEYTAVDAPLIATINGWLTEGIEVTRAKGLDLANQLIKGKNMEKDEHGNDVVLDSHWFKNFCQRNKTKLLGDISGGRNAVTEVLKYNKDRYGPSSEFKINLMNEKVSVASPAALRAPELLGELPEPEFGDLPDVPAEFQGI